jgi:hypothetical protein
LTDRPRDDSCGLDLQPAAPRPDLFQGKAADLGANSAVRNEWLDV